MTPIVTELPWLDAAMSKWIHKTARANFWRVAQLCDLEELVQDGYLCYAKCRARYVDPRKDLTGGKDDIRWFQSLVKTTFERYIHSLAAKHKGINQVAVSQVAANPDTSDELIYDRFLPAQEEEGTLMALIATAPQEVKELMLLLAADGLDLIQYQRRRFKRRLLRETTNELYCRLLGRNPAEENLVRKVRAHFAGM